MIRNDRYFKLENHVLLLGFVIANLAAYAMGVYIELDEIAQVVELIQSRWGFFVALGIGLVFTIIINGLISSQLKAVLVFWRWTNPLPGHRVFTKYLQGDPRIDPCFLKGKIGDFPSDPLEQNRLWFRIYNVHKNEPSVMGAHKEFLLARDAAWLSFAMFIVFGLGLILSKEDALEMTWHQVILFVEYFIASISARLRGIRFVLNVLAVEASCSK